MELMYLIPGNGASEWASERVMGVHTDAKGQKGENFYVPAIESVFNATRDRGQETEDCTVVDVWLVSRASCTL